MQNEILINAGDGETRVALVERNRFSELHIERESGRSVAGRVTLGKVTRVLPGMQAAFVDIGLEKAAFLYAGDYYDGAGQSRDDEDDASRGRRRRNGPNRQPPRIGTLLREGQEIVVQVAKEPIGSKGARITSHLSIAGRHLVLTPWARRVGVSRRVDSDRERRRLRDVINRIRPPELGFIIRTAGDGAGEADLEADVRYLTSVWDQIQLRKEQVSAPAVLYEEPSLPLRAIRDFTNSDTRRIVVDDATVYEELQSFVDRFVADPRPHIERYDGNLPIFDQWNLEAEIDANLGKKVWLKSGGHLVVDQSEALTAIDVNTGRYVGKRDLEETVLKTNLEAVKEVVAQLRFRNIGGLIIIDLIDMETAENREKVYRALQEALRHDKSRTNILKISELGLVEMTRKRTRENLVQTLCEPCSYCAGRGYVLSTESVAFKVLREIRKDLPRFCGKRVAVTVHPQVAAVLTGSATRAREALAAKLDCEIEVHARSGMHQEQFEFTSLSEGPPVEISLPWLGGMKDPDAVEAGASPSDDEKPEPSIEEAPDATGIEALQIGDAAAELVAEAGEELPLAAGGGAAEAIPVGAPPPAPEAPQPELVDAEAEKPILQPSKEAENP